MLDLRPMSSASNAVYLNTLENGQYRIVGLDRKTGEEIARYERGIALSIPERHRAPILARSGAHLVADRLARGPSEERDLNPLLTRRGHGPACGRTE
jgi:hypothetical protein